MHLNLLFCVYLKDLTLWVIMSKLFDSLDCSKGHGWDNYNPWHDVKASDYNWMQELGRQH